MRGRPGVQRPGRRTSALRSTRLIQPAKSGVGKCRIRLRRRRASKKSGRTSARFLGDLADLTEQTRAEFRAAGQPAVENGQEVSAALNKNVEDMQAVFEDNSGAVGKLSVEDDAQFGDQVTLLAQGRKNASKASMRGCKADS